MPSAQASKQKGPVGVDDLAEGLQKVALVSDPASDSENDTPPEADNIPGTASCPDAALPDYVPFHLTRDEESEVTPDFLYHVYDNELNTESWLESSGKTDNQWVKSQDAVEDEKKGVDENHPEHHTVDIFQRRDARKVAKGLNEHVRWWTCTSGKNNLVSWTPSLLFAIIYAIHRVNELGRDPRQISLCVVDTHKLELLGCPPETFVKDLDLFKAFKDKLENQEEVTERHELKDGETWERTWKWSAGGLPNMITFRRQSANHAGGFKDAEYFQADNGNYFGEYLSQGRLKIEGASIIIPFGTIMNDSKSWYCLHPFFEALKEKNPARLEEKYELLKTYMERSGGPKRKVRWARGTMMCKDIFYPLATADKEPTTTEDIDAVDEIISNLEPRWKPVLAASLLALRPRQDNEGILLNAFHDKFLSKRTFSNGYKSWIFAYTLLDANGGDISSLTLRGTPDDKLPEVKLFHDIAEAVIRDQKDRLLDASRTPTTNETPPTTPLKLSTFSHRALEQISTNPPKFLIPRRRPHKNVA